MGWISISVVSPKKSPGLIRTTRTGPPNTWRFTISSPARTTYMERPDSPCFVTTCPTGSACCSIIRMMRSSPSSPSPPKMGIDRRNAFVCSSSELTVGLENHAHPLRAIHRHVVVVRAEADVDRGEHRHLRPGREVGELGRGDGHGVVVIGASLDVVGLFRTRRRVGLGDGEAVAVVELDGDAAVVGAVTAAAPERRRG